MSKILWIILAVVIIGLIVVFGPLVILWALNTLFPILAIPYNFYTWLATVILNLTWMAKVSYKNE